jgi:hypothetical protein
VTECAWKFCATDKDSPGRVIGDIELPANVTGITVWLRLAGTDAAVDNVGVDWIPVKAR